MDWAEEDEAVDEADEEDDDDDDDDDPDRDNGARGGEALAAGAPSQTGLGRVVWVSLTMSQVLGHRRRIFRVFLLASLFADILLRILAISSKSILLLLRLLLRICFFFSSFSVISVCVCVCVCAYSMCVETKQLQPMIIS